MASLPSLPEQLAGIPPEQLDQPCDDDHLLELSLSVTEWQSISPFLGLGRREEEEIEHYRPKRRRLEMLWKWREKLGLAATYRYDLHIYIILCSEEPNNE